MLLSIYLFCALIAWVALFLLILNRLLYFLLYAKCIFLPDLRNFRKVGSFHLQCITKNPSGAYSRGIYLYMEFLLKKFSRRIRGRRLHIQKRLSMLDGSCSNQERCCYQQVRPELLQGLLSLDWKERHRMQMLLRL